VTYLLDTDACIALINGKPEQVRTQFELQSSGGATMVTSSIVVFELWYGVGKSQRQQTNARRLRVFLSGPVDVVEFDDEDAQAAGEVRAALEVSVTPIGAYDILVAGQSLRRGATLVTANVAEFSRVLGLRWEDWARDR
jgi:tRNA(fMet)-specific endonuclease VapC